VGDGPLQEEGNAEGEKDKASASGDVSNATDTNGGPNFHQGEDKDPPAEDGAPVGTTE